MWKILIVDDDFGTRKLINRILYRSAILDHAVNAKEALQAFDLSKVYNDPYNLILLDVTLPDMDGVEVLKKIRGIEEGDGLRTEDRVPVIMVTGRKDTLMKSFSQGCTDYMLKPFQPNELKKKVKDLLETPGQ